MSRAATLLTMRTRVRQRTDLESATARHSDAEINDNINESISELYDILRGAFGQSYYRAVYTFTTTNGVATYALPSDFLALVSVDIYMGGSTSGARYSATPYMESERNQYLGMYGTWNSFGCPAQYHLFGNNIAFIPNPSQGVLVSVNYVPTPTKLVLDGDTFDGIAGWEEFVVLDAAIKSLLKDDGLE